MLLSNCFRKQSHNIIKQIHEYEVKYCNVSNVSKVENFSMGISLISKKMTNNLPKYYLY